MHSPKHFFFFAESKYRETDMDKNKTENKHRSVAKLHEILKALEK